AGVERDALADIAVGADHKPRRPAAILHRLRRRPQRSERRNDGARADRRMAGDVHVRQEPAAFADGHIPADDAVGTDLGVGGDGGALVDQRGRMDFRHGQRSVIIAPTSASATSWPATLASPRNHHMFRRRATLVMWYSTTSPGTTGRRNLALSM